MADNRRAFGPARPVVAGLVLARRRRLAVEQRAGQRVVSVGRIAAAIDDVALLGGRRLLAKVVRGVHLVDIAGDHHPLGIAPWTGADAVARIDRRLAVRLLRAEIGAPSMASRADRFGELLAMLVRTVEPAKIAAMAEPHAGHEEGHVVLLR